MLSNGRIDSVVDEKRIHLTVYIFVAIFFGFIGRLWYLQVFKGREFSVASEKNRFREVRKSAPRGTIYDHNGALILGNRPFFDLVIIPQYLQNKEQTLNIVSKLFHISRDDIDKRLKEAASLPRFVPVRIKKNLVLHEVAMVESNKFFMPGVEIDAAPRRAYVGTEASHLLGYLGEVTSKDLDLLNAQVSDFQYRLGATIGKMGIERKYEQYLRGTEGKDYLQVDAYGRLRTSDISEFQTYQPQPAKRGYDVYLTIDADVQKVAVEAFKQKNGAAVALNAQTGEVLAYVSNPNFDLSTFQESLSSEDWQSFQLNPFKPLLDKVTGGAYPPGSTFKIVTAIAALEEGVVGPDTTFNCPGYFRLGHTQWRCDARNGHGRVNMRQAIEASCDVYFYQLGNLLGGERIAKWAREFGLGEKSGLNLNMEVPGIAPDPEWKIHNKNQPWTAGDSINMSIGQGLNLATPLQIAAMYSALGNGGRLYRPHLLKKVVNEAGDIVVEEKNILRRQIAAKPANIKVVQEGTFDVVNGPRGTGRRARVKGFNVSGKSGTAQTAALHKTSQMDDLAFMQRDHAWFAAYSPSEKPEITVVVLSEYDGGHGGLEAAPIVQKIIEAYLKKNHPERFANGQAETVSIKHFVKGPGDFIPDDSEPTTGTAPTKVIH